MTISEAIIKMNAAAESAKERLGCFGLDMKVETDYMNGFFKTVEKPEKAKYATVSLVMSTEGIAEGEEYCISLGVEVKRGKVDETQLAEDAVRFDEMVTECIGVLSGSETVLDGLNTLIAKATEECEKLIAEMEENQKKSRRVSMISNIIFFAGIALLFIVALLRQ